MPEKEMTVCICSGTSSTCPTPGCPIHALAADAGPRQPVNCADPSHKSGSVFHVDGGLCPLAGYEPTAANESNIHDKLVMGWLVRNAKTPDEVKWASYPIGMVQRWIERAQEAEAKIGCVAPVPQEAAPRCPFGYTKEQPGTKHECAIHNLSDYAAPAPDEAMRVAEQIITDFGRATPSTSEQFKRHVGEVAALIREAGSERERELRAALRELAESARVTVSGFRSGREHTPEKHLCDSCDSNIDELAEDLAEASRLLGGE